MPRTLIVLVLVGGLVVAVGELVGYRWAVAPLIFMGLWVWLRAMLRSFISHGQTGIAASDEPEPVPVDERVLYWCEECGTEVVLLVRGSGLPPRHCGTKMHERSEILS